MEHERYSLIPRTHRISLLYILVFTVVLVSTSPALENSSAPELQGLTVVFENIGPGFLENLPSGRSATNALYANFFVYISEIETFRPQIKSLRIEDPSGSTWTINLTEYADPDLAYLGGWGRWRYGEELFPPNSLMPLRYLVKLELIDGRRIEKTFDALPPGVQDSSASSKTTRFESPAPRFLANSAFLGVRTPYHTQPIEPAIVTAGWLDEGFLKIRFRVEGPRPVNGRITLYNAQREHIGTSPKFLRNKVPVQWINKGAWLRNGPVENEVMLDMRSIDWEKGKGINDFYSFSVVLQDQQSPDSNLRRLSYLYQSRTGMYKISTTEDSLPLLQAPETLKLLTLYNSDEAPTPPLWDGSDATRRLWLSSLSGILSTLNGFLPSGLEHFALTKANIDAALSGLISTWGIHDRASLLTNLQTLFEQGQSARWDSYCLQLDKQPGATAQELVKSAPDERFTAEGYIFTDQFRETIDGKSLRAWDLGRLVFLVRDGYAFGFLTEDEAWEWLEKAGTVIRERYRSWPEFASHFMIGRMFWGGTKEEMRLYMAALKVVAKLLGKDGAWANIPWPPRADADTNFVQEPQ